MWSLRPLVLLLVSLPATASAVGGEQDTPPIPSETTTECAEGLVWDLATETCLPPEESTNDDSARLQDLRELAHAGRYADATRVLETIDDQSGRTVLAYKGFLARKSGDLAGGIALYQAALAEDPDNLLARSYLGQAYVELGDMASARTELTEIRLRGGRSTWPEYALRVAIDTGQGFAY